MEKSDHDILIENSTLLKELKEQFVNHLRHHFWVNVTLLTIIGGLLVALLLK